ncbi:probable serine/threonine-protein kinase DDB_G0282963 [Musca vetustissima]|uniref:probable serine/threonine-protein kinase DDB_G0282963 n=1 Tax=Musca vetustissima TaxID=27455 RepID=UPI002AB74845|nr:probable serine/threonine-protein kinase DDB_G0282963 [Musca vetustissima]
MPGKVAVKIKAGRNLPVMDKSSDTTDAYVEIKLGNVTHKTDVCRKSLNPVFNSDWFRFEVDDAELQDEILQIRLMDYDTYSANDAIGKVNISLNPLCLETSGQSHGKGTVLSGWIPVFDTMHGIRGEVHVIVKVDLFSDANKFRQSSCGIPFFHSPCIPTGYRAQVIHGFVEELVVNDDPEYQWIDKIRTPRASNEARQVVFLKLSGQVQRKMGLKAINMGANAVIGYTQCFDLEGDVGVVARGVGTAVTLIKDTTNQPTSADSALIEERTLKYLEFLRGGNFSTSQRPQTSYSTQSLNKLNFDHLAMNGGGRGGGGGDDCSDSDTEHSSNLMLNLIQQEEGRGDRPLKKFTHKMRNFTTSSRNIFGDKCASLMRKIDENQSSSDGSRSLSGVIYFPGKNLKIRSESNSMLDVRKSAGSTGSHHWAGSSRSDMLEGGNKKSKGLQKTIHPIVRSVSDDSAMKQSASASHGTCGRNHRNKHNSAIYVESESAINTQPTTTSTTATKMNNESTIESEEVEKDNHADSLINICKDTTSPQVIHTSTFSSSPKELYHKTEFSLFQESLEMSPNISVAEIAPTNRCCLSHNDLNYLTKSYSSSQPVLHSQSLNNLNAPMTALTTAANAIKTKRSYCRPASIILNDPTNNDLFRQPVLKLCPSTPTPSESDSLASPCSSCRVNAICGGGGGHSLSLSPNSLFSFTNTTTATTLSDPEHLNHIGNILRFPPCNHNNAKFIASSINENTSTNNNNSNSNAQNPLLVPFISNNNAGITITNHQNHRQHRSLSEIAAGGSSNHSNNSSPHTKGHHVSPATIMPMNADEEVAAAKLSTINTNSNANTITATTTTTNSTTIPSNVGNRSKLTPSPTRSGVVATPASIQSQSDSLSSATTISTATTIIPKEMGEMCRRSSDSDLSVTPKGIADFKLRNDLPLLWINSVTLEKNFASAA